jgi:hypothetical protein
MNAEHISLLFGDREREVMQRDEIADGGPVGRGMVNGNGYVGTIHAAN